MVNMIVDFEPGEEVFVPSLKKHGIIVSGVSKKGQILVQIGSLQYWINSDELGTSRKKVHAKKTKKEKKTRQSAGTASIDLHGMTIDEALDRTAQAINDAALSRKEALEIIHGRGTGALKKAVTGYLEKSGFSFREKPGNPGTTIVYF